MEFYSINGIGVGRHPSTFERSEIYKNNFDKLGDSINNIKVIKNFLSEEKCKELIGLTKNISPAVTDEQWSNKIFSSEDISSMLLLITGGIEYHIGASYGLHVAIAEKPYIVRWLPGDSMGPHVDDLGYEINHISSLIYLNDDYEGGEINFITHNLSIKPTQGDLLIFPGNLNYAHEVTPITSGERYTAPIWFKYI